MNRCRNQGRTSAEAMKDPPHHPHILTLHTALKGATGGAQKDPMMISRVSLLFCHQHVGFLCPRQGPQEFQTSWLHSLLHPSHESTSNTPQKSMEICQATTLRTAEQFTAQCFPQARHLPSLLEGPAIQVLPSP